MERYAIVDFNGQIHSIMVVGSSAPPIVGAELVAVWCPETDVKDDTHYFDSEGFVEYPPKPGQWAAFDFAAKQWFDPRTPDFLADELAQIKRSANLKILAVIKSIRASMITDLPGQEMIYLRKEAEARAYVADPAPDMTNYPLMVREIGITAPTAGELAQVWLYMANQLMSVAGLLEAVRLSASALLEGATTEAEVDMVRDGLLAQMGV
ncbi:MAG: hypothetical protein Q7J44_14245 [Pseudotabrizicola sp.]|uniref:hypothetical protein n=1 Tax=Pseudotabrizicola sp. TaxID=2939647 RepID=UPI00271A5218|nr:hypothetical protein [Pseudotabrizicola sp.]MDO9639697.1 hypothetical protein [Pseudotabrizicola sp.]